MAWIILFVAGLLEIVWAVALKQSHGFTRLVPSLVTLAGMAGSIVFLALATQLALARLLIQVVTEDLLRDESSS